MYVLQHTDMGAVDVCVKMQQRVEERRQTPRGTAKGEPDSSELFEVRVEVYKEGQRQSRRREYFDEHTSIKRGISPLRTGTTHTSVSEPWLPSKKP